LAPRRSVVVAGQEGRREFGLRPVVVAAVARGAVAALRTLAVPARTAVTAAPTAAVAATATTIAITAGAAIATLAALARFPRREGVFRYLAGLQVDDAHRQADLAARVDLEDLDLHFLAFGDDVGRLLDPLVLHLGDVDEAVLAAHEVHERAEVDDVDDLAAVDLADLALLDDAEDPLL